MTGRGAWMVVALLLVATACSGSDQGSTPGADATPAQSPSSSPAASRTASAGPTLSESPSPTPTGPPRTSCTRVVHVGESTSIGLTSASYLPNAKDRLPAQLRSVGVKKVQTDISGARSIIERWHDQPNAEDAVNARKAAGFQGCWTIAMGTNEAANQAAGSTFGSAMRIGILMKAIGKHDPVLWLTTKTLIPSGSYYNDSNMVRFNKALRAACRRYPNLHVFDWRPEAKRPWFSSDGIHYTPFGYRQRAHRIAQALAVAYPRGFEPASRCVVGSGVPPRWGIAKKRHPRTG